MIDRHGITFPVGYGLVAEEISRITGAYYDKEENYLHATGFLLRPDKTILIVCYSSGAIGRLVPKDVLQLTRYFKRWWTWWAKGVTACPIQLRHVGHLQIAEPKRRRQI